MGRSYFFATILVAALSLAASATIINVPADQSTIQQGIDVSNNGDTVLVQPGTYFENIDINKDSLVVGSLYLTTGDTSYISQTVIDGTSSGSVVVFSSDDSKISGFTIQNGEAMNGGGIYCWSKRIHIADCAIINNNADSLGGGIYWYIRIGSSISNCSVSFNNASIGGGIYYYCNVAPLSNIQNCMINNNSAEFGGGIAFRSFGVIGNSVFVSNTAIIDGGGFYLHKTEQMETYLWEFYNNLVYFNTAGRYGGGGAGPILDLPARDCECWIDNSTFYGNSAGEKGGALYLRLLRFAILKSCIFWNNHAFEYDHVNDQPNGVAISYSDIQGGWAGDGIYNIDCDPFFCDTDNDNFYLAENSCCLGTGEDGSDIGAYGVGCDSIIYQYLPGDANMYNGAWPPMVIGADVTYLVNYFRGPGSSQPCYINGFWSSADANGDCRIIGSDVTRLVTYFLGQTELSCCPIHPSAWPTPADIPENPPEGWPNCE